MEIWAVFCSLLNGKPISDNLKNMLDFWLQLITMLGAAIAFIYTLCTWRRANKI
jgi:hypothetical protein